MKLSDTLVRDGVQTCCFVNPFTYLSVVDSVGLRVDRVVYGSLMTSLEMAGVSLTLLKLQPGWDKLIDLHATAPGWPRVCGLRVDSDPLPCEDSKREQLVSREPATSLGGLIVVGWLIP